MVAKYFEMSLESSSQTIFF